MVRRWFRRLSAVVLISAVVELTRQALRRRGSGVRSGSSTTSRPLAPNSLSWTHGSNRRRIGPDGFHSEPQGGAAREPGDQVGNQMHNQTGNGVGNWVEPVDGRCPDSHPVKGNASSGIFHVPGGLSYDRTIAERCYDCAESAEADSFRRSKR